MLREIKRFGVYTLCGIMIGGVWDIYGGSLIMHNIDLRASGPFPGSFLRR